MKLVKNNFTNVQFSRLKRRMDWGFKTGSSLAVEVSHGDVIKLGLEHHEPTIRTLMDMYVKVAQQPKVADIVFHRLLSAYSPVKQLMMMYHWCFDYASAIDGIKVVQELHSQVLVLGLENTDLHVGMLMSLYTRVTQRPDLACQIFSRLKRPGYAAWRNLIWAYAVYDPSKAIASFGEMEKTHIKPTLGSFRALLLTLRPTPRKKTLIEVLVKMKTVYHLEPDVKHFGCYMDKLVKSGYIGEAIQVAAGIKCPISNQMCGMIFGECAKSLRADFDSANRMIQLLVDRGGKYVVDYPVYNRLNDQGVKFPPSVQCGPQHYRERGPDRLCGWSRLVL